LSLHPPIVCPIPCFPVRDCVLPHKMSFAPLVGYPWTNWTVERCLNFAHESTYQCL